jgi:NADPH2:quinone reductase
MRAVVCSAYGEPEDLELLEIPVPTTGPGQVLVGVEAAAVNFPDVLLIANRYQITVPLPFTPGSEFAGRILQVADDVGGYSVGDRVFGSTLVGAFGEAVAVPASSLTVIPGGVESSQAAAFGVAHRTAYHVLRSVACVEPGDELVVLGAGGGVGLAAVQLGALLGGKVTAVASSPEKLEAARLHGAVRTIDYRAGDLRQSLRELLPHGADIVVDPVGGALSEPALRSLRWGGRFITVGYAAGEIPRIPLNLVLLKGVHILGFQFRDFATHAEAEMARNDGELLGLLGSERVRPHIGSTFPLEGTTEALRHVADGRAVGKVVIEVRSTLS